MHMPAIPTSCCSLQASAVRSLLAGPPSCAAVWATATSRCTLRAFGRPFAAGWTSVSDLPQAVPRQRLRLGGGHPQAVPRAAHAPTAAGGAWSRLAELPRSLGSTLPARRIHVCRLVQLRPQVVCKPLPSLRCDGRPGFCTYTKWKSPTATQSCECLRQKGGQSPYFAC